MPTRSTPSPERAAAAAAVLRALANPRRLLIVCELFRSEEASAGDLAHRLGLAPSALSQHLGRLRSAGLIGYRRAARTLFYRLDGAYRDRLGALVRGMCADCGMPGVAGLACGAAASAGPPRVATPRRPKGFWKAPAIAGAGAIHALPDARWQPDPAQSQRLVFAIAGAGVAPERVHPGFERVARAVNLYVGAGVVRRRLQVRAVVYGPATPSILADRHYRRLFGTANPNLPVIGALGRRGVEIAVCGQAIVGAGYEPAWVGPGVALALSGITAIAELQRRGYALVP